MRLAREVEGDLATLARAPFVPARRQKVIMQAPGNAIQNFGRDVLAPTKDGHATQDKDLPVARLSAVTARIPTRCLEIAYLNSY